jgi:hypothetical protein
MTWLVQARCENVMKNAIRSLGHEAKPDKAVLDEVQTQGFGYHLRPDYTIRVHIKNKYILDIKIYWRPIVSSYIYVICS